MFESDSITRITWSAFAKAWGSAGLDVDALRRQDSSPPRQHQGPVPTGADPLSSRSIAEAEAADYLQFRDMLARDLLNGVGPRSAPEVVEWAEAGGLEGHVAARFAERFLADLDRYRERARSRAARR